MKKQRKIILILALITSVNAVLFSTEIHVSKSGADSNTGSIDAPFLTIAKAASIAQAGDVVYIHEGTYEETLKPSNSGANGNPIVFQSYENHKVIITAMQALSGWTHDVGSIYKTSVDWNLGQENFVMNGAKALDLARWPNNTDGDLFTLNSLRNNGGSGANDINAHLTHADIPDFAWENGGSVFFYGDKSGSGWLAWKAWITSSSAGRVDFKLDKNPNWIRTFHYPEAQGDFYLEGIKEALDYENEWFFNENTKTLYVQLPGGAAPDDNKVQMRKRKLTVDLNGKNYIEIKNLALFGGSVEINGTGNVLYGVSSFYGNTTRGIMTGFMSGSQSVLIKGKNNTIEKCEIAFGSGSGIWNAAYATQILNCSIHDFNFLGCYDAPIMARGETNAVIKQNSIYRGGRDAIQIVQKNSEVAYNDIYQSNLIADDCALLYTLGAGLNMKIHHNWFHDAKGRGGLHKAAGIYLDNDAGDVDVYNNVVWNTEWSSIQINWNGTNLNIFSNTLFNGSAAMGAWHKEGTSFSNVKVWNNLYNQDPLEEQADKQNNLKWPGDGDLIFNNMAAKDFSLRSGSMAIDYGREIEGFTDGFVGAAPDAGAYEDGNERWLAGITWNAQQGPTGNGCYGLPGETCSGSTKIGYTKHNNSDLLIYPNPAAGNTLCIKNNANFRGEFLQYSIISVDGRLHVVNQIPNSANIEIDIANLTDGIYLLNLKSGKQNYSAKILKQ